MPKDHGKTLTRLFVTASQSVSKELIDQAFADFIRRGWEEQHDEETGFRCLVKLDADIAMVREAAKNNPGMVFLCFTQSCETKLTTLNVGFGGAWLSKTRRFSKAIDPGIAHAAQSYISTFEQEPTARRPRRPKSAGQAPSGTGTSSTAASQPRTRKTKKHLAPMQVNSRLVFHGLPAEVERCRELAVSAIPAEARPGLKYTTNGGEGYVAGSLEVRTANEPAFNAFNRLVAQVPAVTVTLEYDDPKTATRRLLRAVDGKIVEHRAV
jgi:hypothetical protein